MTYNPGTTMTIYDIPSDVKTPLFSESFSSKYQNRLPDLWNLPIQRGYFLK
jgi:hypothetical protein